MKPSMLAELTDLMSRVGRANPDLMRDRNVALFTQACIEEARRSGAPEFRTIRPASSQPLGNEDIPHILPPDSDGGQSPL